jgi:hypothetical protein
VARRHAFNLEGPFNLEGRGVNVRTLGWVGLVFLLLLPACGAQTTDSASDVATPEVAVAAKQDLQAGLDSIALPQQYIPGLPLGLRLSDDSGWVGNEAEAEGSFDPDDSAKSLGEAGRITGYQLAYYDPLRAALSSGSGVDGVVTWVELFSSARAASAYLHDRVDYARNLAGTSPREGVSFGAVTPFEFRMLADEAFGQRQTVVYDGDRVFRTVVRFRRGRIVAGGTIVRADSQDAIADMERMAGDLDSRVETALRGLKNPDPVLIPLEEVPLEAPAGVPDLAAIALGPADLPPGIRCEPGRYTHTTPPRITFQRSFCPQDAVVGHTTLTGLTSIVSVFESELAAKTSMNLEVMSLMSPDGIKGFASNYAASTGRIPTHIRSHQLKLEGGGIGLLTTFDTTTGPEVDFYALSQRGRGLTTLDTMGPAEGFDYRDMLPLLKAVERRLSSLG